MPQNEYPVVNMRAKYADEAAEGSPLDTAIKDAATEEELQALAAVVAGKADKGSDVQMTFGTDWSSTAFTESGLSKLSALKPGDIVSSSGPGGSNYAFNGEVVLKINNDVSTVQILSADSYAVFRYRSVAKSGPAVGTITNYIESIGFDGTISVTSSGSDYKYTPTAAGLYRVSTYNGILIVYGGGGFFSCTLVMTGGIYTGSGSGEITLTKDTGGTKLYKHHISNGEGYIDVITTSSTPKGTVNSDATVYRMSFATDAVINVIANNPDHPAFAFAYPTYWTTSEGEPTSGITVVPNANFASTEKDMVEWLNSMAPYTDAPITDTVTAL